jgi:hypothetical protein
MTGFEIKRATIIGRAVIPAGAFGGLAGETDWDATIRRQLDVTPPLPRFLTRLAFLLAWVAPFFMGYFRFFGALSDAARVEALERLCKARNYQVRQLMVVLKLNICLCVMGNERVLRHLNAYDFGKPIRQLELGRTGT